MSTVKVDTIEAAGAGPVTIPSLDKRMASAWVDFDGTGTVAILGSYNVSSITDMGVGQYVINFAVPMNNTFYALAGSARSNVSTRAGFIALSTGTGVKTTTGFTVNTYQGADQAIVDSPDVGLIIFGGRA